MDGFSWAGFKGWAQHTCSQLRPRSSRQSLSFGFSLSAAVTARASNAFTSASMAVFETMAVLPAGLAARVNWRLNGLHIQNKSAPEGSMHDLVIRNGLVV